jgi:DNA (cytosine-5)-methyltransferase 1
MRTTKPRLLDLFCGAGGCSIGYWRAGFDVVGVDNRPQPCFPKSRCTFVEADALAYLAQHGGEFDAIHASPPCQAFTAYKRRKDHVRPRENLIPSVREMLRLFTSEPAWKPPYDGAVKPYVIENVGGAPLEDPVMLCGSSFGLDVRRHRYFESNIKLSGKPCRHDLQTPRFAPATTRKNLRSTVEVGVWRIPLDVQQQAMGIDWMPLRELSQAIPPAYTHHLGLQLLMRLGL